MPLAQYLVYYTCEKARGVVNILHFWHGAWQWPDFSTGG
jgi:hypothetical protein